MCTVGTVDRDTPQHDLLAIYWKASTGDVVPKLEGRNTLHCTDWSDGGGRNKR